MTTQNETKTPSLVVTMAKDNAKYATQVERAKVRNIIIAELQQAGVSAEPIAFRNLPVMYPLIELADLLALKLDGRENFKQGTVESFQNYGTAIQSLAVEGFKKAPLTTQPRMTTAPAQSSDILLKQSVLESIEERLTDIRAYMLRCYDSVLTNPARYLADNADNLTELGFISLASYESAFELPLDRIQALLQSEKYAAQLQTFRDELVCNKASNFRVHETYLVCDGQPTAEQRASLASRGYALVAKDTSALQAEITSAMTNQDFASVVKLSQDLLTLQNTVEIRKALTE